jgi:hypothetical protein
MGITLTQHSYCVCVCLHMVVHVDIAHSCMCAPYRALSVALFVRVRAAGVPCLHAWFVTCSAALCAAYCAPLALGLSEGVGCSTRLVDHSVALPPTFICAHGTKDMQATVTSSS